jgi:hypothetical protein
VGERRAALLLDYKAWTAATLLHEDSEQAALLHLHGYTAPRHEKQETKNMATGELILSFQILIFRFSILACFYLMIGHW